MAQRYIAGIGGAQRCERRRGLIKEDAVREADLGVLAGERIGKGVALVAGAAEGEIEKLALVAAKKITWVVVIDGIADLLAMVGRIEGGAELDGMAEAQASRGVKALDEKALSARSGMRRSAVVR